MSETKPGQEFGYTPEQTFPETDLQRMNRFAESIRPLWEKRDSELAGHTEEQLETELGPSKKNSEALLEELNN